MKTHVNLCVIFFVLFIACKKNDVAPNPNPNPNPNPAPRQDTLLKKLKISSNYSADSSEFSYDNSGRIIKEDFRGNSFGSDQRIVTSITRNNSGVITGYTKTYYTAGAVNKTETSTMHYDPLTSHCTSKVTTYSAGSGIWMDSVFYTYAGNQLTVATEVTKQTATSAYDSAFKTYYYYGANNTANMPIRKNSWSYYYGWGSDKEFTGWEGDGKINPLYDPAIGFFVGLNINQADDDNFDWNYGAFFPDNMKTTITFGTQYAHFTYTYASDNRPLERVYEDLGSFVNRVTFSY